MVELKKETEEKILEAAKQVFIQKGKDGARMQEIADEAGINKSLLHYYYRSKDNLFEAVFKDAIRSFFPRITGAMQSDEIDIFQKIEFFVGAYIDLLVENPFIPGFVIMEVNRNKDQVLNMFDEAIDMIQGDSFPVFARQVVELSAQGKIRPVPPHHLIINILSLCAFPVIARPVVQGILFQNSDDAYQQFLSERKQIVSEFIINSIKVK